MQLTVCCETVFTDRPLVDRFAAVRALGVDGIELWELPSHKVGAIEAALHAAGCQLRLFCGNRHHSLVDANERTGFLTELKESLAHAARLGCSRLTILSDKLNAQGIAIPSDRPLTNEQKLQSVQAGLKQAAALAEAASVTLLLEPLNTKIDHPRYTLANSGPAFDIVRRIGSPRLKVLYDVYHMQIMEGNPVATLEANLGDIGHIHVADVPGRYEPGTGKIDWSSIANLLRAKKYEGYVGLECYPRGRSDAAIESFCKLFDPKPPAYAPSSPR